MLVIEFFQNLIVLLFRLKLTIFLHDFQDKSYMVHMKQQVPTDA